MMYGRPRHPQWDKESSEFIDEMKKCEVCGCRDKRLLQVHHKLPYHLFPEKEMDRDNWMVLCMSPQRCHFIFGHCGNWKWYRENVVEFASTERELRRRLQDK